jgi:CHAT domain-containing protein
VKPGDELSGLSASLLYAGVSAVISTLWSVADRETRQLILHFYTAALERGSNLAVALQQAQCEILSRSRSSHPYFWAAFQLWGQWSNKLARHSMV